MRRKDREVTDIEETRAIIANCKTCHLAMIDGNKPYVVPLSFGYELENGQLILYFHSAKEGRKLDILRKNPAVCFEMCREGELNDFENPCNAGYYFESLIGSGSAEFVDGVDERCRALTLLMKHQSGREFEFTEVQANSVCVYKVVSVDFTAKRKKNPNKN